MILTGVVTEKAFDEDAEYMAVAAGLTASDRKDGGESVWKEILKKLFLR